ncbi:MAG: DEAD/DEAH box helicase [Desulfamplus sp.]|nr:DEAD/DEAH box helicase [Desulfamplus sp.]
MEFKAGSLVRARDRDWIVLPSNDKNLLMLKPLGGSEEETTAIYLPLSFIEDPIESTEFPIPAKEDLKDFSSAKLLYNCIRLSFRNGAGPFRSLAKLSFRPRPYQMVPLIMSLRQNSPIRLLIADDVGIGKTIEAILILKELLERGEISRFAVIALPHLCEQWQAELKDKVGIEAVIIRSNTQSRLDREIHGDTSVYEYYPYQVISIDYIKSDKRRQIFLQECPNFIIVDEIHTCIKPTGASVSAQQRYHLIHDIAEKENQNLILLTATPHSGKQEEFNALLGLLKKDYENFDIPSSSQSQRKDLAAYYVQRRRADVSQWMGEDTPFPKRDAGEYQYVLSNKYSSFYDDTLAFAVSLIKKSDKNTESKFRYWAALSLLRGVMSSPAAGLEMIENRMTKIEGFIDDYFESSINPMLDEDFGIEKDFTPTNVINKPNWSANENKKLKELSENLKNLHNINYDNKAKKSVEIIKDWLKSGFNTIVFCRFIATANYLGEILKKELSSEINVQVITSEFPDEVRKAKIEDMAPSKHRVLVATDCLSEGINLQDKFTAVLHYDLPWNPNRLEQREGRIDRFGQTAPIVKTYLLYGANNPIDGVVLKVLLRKVREIRKSIGISIPFPEDSQSLMDAVLQAVLLDFKEKPKMIQLTLFDDNDEVIKKELIVTKSIDKAAEREKISRSIFAQHSIKAGEIEQDLKQSDDAIGNPQAVEIFVTEALTRLFGVQIHPDKKGYILYTTNLPLILKSLLPQSNQIKISFYSPTPEGYIYFGRNHLFVEQLCQYLTINSFNRNTQYGLSRAAVLKCKVVDIKTTIILFRVRNVIEEKNTNKQLVAEEMLLWGYKGYAFDKNIISIEEIQNLMTIATPTTNLTEQAKADFFENELKIVNELREELDKIAFKRAGILIEAHERFRKVIGGKQYKVVEPVLPMDLIGIYILLPDK